MTRLTETFTTNESRKPDRESGVIPGIRILGRVSSNGRRYSDKAMESAARLGEGQRAYLDHNNGERKIREWIGVWRNVKSEGTGDDRCNRADLHYLKSHPLAETICEAAERFADSFGASHDADGKVSGQAGKQLVEDVDKLHSIDVVCRPATNKGLYESHQDGDEMAATKTTIAAILMEAAKSSTACKTPQYKLLKSMHLGEMDGDIPMPEMPAEVLVEPEASPEEQIMAGLMAAIQKKLESADEATLKKVMKTLGIGDPVSAATGGGGEASNSSSDSGSSDGGGEGGSEEDKPKESAELNRLKTQLAESEKRNNAVAVLAEAGIPATAARIKAVAACETADERKELLESFRPARNLASGDYDKPDRSPSAIDWSQSGDGDDSYDKVKESVGETRLFG